MIPYQGCPGIDEVSEPQHFLELGRIEGEKEQLVFDLCMLLIRISGVRLSIFLRWQLWLCACMRGCERVSGSECAQARVSLSGPLLCVCVFYRILCRVI